MNIASIRKRRGLTQIDLAYMTKVTQPTISRAEKGDDSTTLATLKQIAAALDVELTDLFVPNRSDTEETLVRLFRSLPEDRQKGWLDLARVTVGLKPEEIQ